jgi:DnaK suppressor protein
MALRRRIDMTQLTQQEQAALQKQLTDRQRALQAEIADALRKSEDPHAIGVAGRMAEAGDWAVAEVEADIEIALVKRDMDELRDIESALARIEEGTYGQCVDCGKPIRHARLVVYPTAKRCIACQEALEARQGVGPPTL